MHSVQSCRLPVDGAEPCPFDPPVFLHDDKTTWGILKLSAKGEYHIGREKIKLDLSMPACPEEVQRLQALLDKTLDELVAIGTA